MGLDYQLSDASGKTWTLDEQGEVTSVGEKADTKLAQNQGKNNLPKGQPKSENFEIQWDFSQSAFAFDASGEIPYKALVKGKNDVFQVVIKQKDTLRYSFHFQTDKGLKVDSKKEKEGVFEISRKGLFDFGDEELWVVAKNAKTEKEEVVGKCMLVHLSEKEVNVTLIPTTENLQIDIDAIQRIYAKVGVKLHISTDEIFPVKETIDTKNAFGDLSTYSPEQQAIIAWYKSERATKPDTYYVFVGKQEGSQVGYMRLGGQFGFALDGNSRTIAHELGHGIFKLEHSFKNKGDIRNPHRLMDYAGGENFTYNDWKQINDPKLKIYVFQSQDDGEFVKGILTVLNKPRVWTNNKGSFCDYNINYIKSIDYGYGTKYLLDDKVTELFSSKIDLQVDKHPSQRVLITEGGKDNYYYIYDPIDKRWVEGSLPRKEHKSTDLDFLFKGFWTGMKYVSRYAIPLEDAIILVDGKDFDGEESSRVASGASIALDLIQVGKLVKVVKAGAKITTTTGKVTRKYFIDHKQQVGKYALMEFSTQLTICFLTEMYNPNNRGAEVSVLLKKAYAKLDWQDIFFAASQGIKVKSKITDEQVNCVYRIYRQFSENESSIDGAWKSVLDCCLPLAINRGYGNIKKTKFFNELGKALQDQRKYDIVIDYLSKITTKQTRDEFIKQILEKAIQEHYK
ncbi:hypothetical protein ACILE9_07165 [Capnocytophaga cynodegmi]|uniref:hypothetical protein n=1 Tax=Capnocytophaga cynodegmi TaxID=28189 RepID=UPI0037D6E7E9